MQNEQQDPRQAGRFENKLKAFIADLEKKEYAPSTLRTRYEGVQSFFEQNKVALKMMRTDGPSGEAIGKRAAEKKEVLRALKKASPEKRRLILFLKDSGLRLGDVLRIRWRDIKDMGDGFWHISKITQKRQVLALSFIGPDATREFAEMGVEDELVFPDRRTNGIKNIAGVSESLSMYLGDELSAHSLRKFFAHTMQNPKLHIDPDWVKRFMGKHIPKERKPYVENRPQKLLAAYRNAYADLSVYGYESTRMEQLESEIETLKVKNLEMKTRINGLEREKEEAKYWTITPEPFIQHCSKP